MRYLMLLIPMLLMACRGPEAGFVYVTLKTGPRSAEKTPEERQKVFEGHMANMRRLADEGRLVIAGPFDHPGDASWRGLFVMNVATVAEAGPLVATDPGVVAGVFTPELVPMRASPAIRETLPLSRERDRNPPAVTSENPHPNIRAYVLVMAEDAGACGRALAAAGMAGRVVWSGRFGPPREGGGVFALDAEDAGAVRAALDAHGPGRVSVDGWWSDTVVARLPRPGV